MNRHAHGRENKSTISIWFVSLGRGFSISMFVRSSVGATPLWLNPCLQGHPEQYHHSKPWRGCKSYRPVRKGHCDLQCIVGGHPASHEKQHVLCKLDGLGDACSVPNSDWKAKKMHPNSFDDFWRLRMVSWFQVHACRRTAGCRRKDEAWRLLLLPKRSSFVSRVSLHLPFNLQDGYLPSRYHTVHTDQCDMEHDLQSPSQAIRIFQGRNPPFLTAKPQGRGVEINSILPGLERVRASRTHHSDSTVCIGF